MEPKQITKTEFYQSLIGDIERTLQFENHLEPEITKELKHIHSMCVKRLEEVSGPDKAETPQANGVTDHGAPN